MPPVMVRRYFAFRRVGAVVDGKVGPRGTFQRNGHCVFSDCKAAGSDSHKFGSRCSSRVMVYGFVKGYGRSSKAFGRGYCLILSTHHQLVQSSMDQNKVARVQEGEEARRQSQRGRRDMVRRGCAPTTSVASTTLMMAAGLPPRRGNLTGRSLCSTDNGLTRQWDPGKDSAWARRSKSLRR